MPKKSKITETQKLVMRAAYDKYYLTFGSQQKAWEKVGEEFGLHWQTVRKIIQSAKGMNRGIISDVKKHQATKIDKIINKVLEDLDNAEKVFKGMSPAQAVLAVSQLIDKAAKLKGDDVQKIEIHEMGDKLEEKLKELQNIKTALQKALVVPDNSEKVEEN